MLKMFPMIIVHVHARVRPEFIDAFKETTIENAQHSVKEPGIVRFDLIQEELDPTRFVLVEIYRDEDAVQAHKQTAHYAKWRQTVEPMMAEPRRSVRYKPCFPAQLQW